MKEIYKIYIKLRTKFEKKGDYYKIMFTMDVEICPNNTFYLIFDLINPLDTNIFYLFKAHREEASTVEVRRYGVDSDMFNCLKTYSDISTTDESYQNFVPPHSLKREFIPIKVSQKHLFNNLFYLNY